MSSPASEKQINFIKSLINDRKVDQCAAPTAIYYIEDLIAKEQFTSITKVMASSAIDQLMAGPKKVSAKAVANSKTIEPGFYKVGDNIYKVQKSPNSGYCFAKVLTGHGFEYAKGAIKTIMPADKLTLEDAKEYGKVHGSCIICQRTLTDEASINAGIGPICAGKYF